MGVLPVHAQGRPRPEGRAGGLFVEIVPLENGAFGDHLMHCDSSGPRGAPVPASPARRGSEERRICTLIWRAGIGEGPDRSLHPFSLGEQTTNGYIMSAYPGKVRLLSTRSNCGANAGRVNPGFLPPCPDPLYRVG